MTSCRDLRGALVGAVLGSVLLIGGCGRFADADDDLPPGEAVVDHPVDGDTIVVRIDGARESVRLIGIDTPESVARERPVECFGVEAKHRTAELLPAGTRVRLERDIEARDQYGRLLAYVHRVEDGVFVNLLLVEEGYAEAFPYRPNTAHQADFDRAEADARAGQRGLWPVCGGTDVPVGPAPG
ncbi:MAG: thermonuclease family protein [Actinomycetota bacterium]|nr:thermonuclease family protein [Actinomycetota bacterium]